MKKILIFIFMLLSASAAFCQKSKTHKLTKDEMANMTPDQRFVHESERKAGKKSNISNKRKVKIQKRQARKSEHIKQPKRKHNGSPK
jgi:hypothetical protein